MGNWNQSTAPAFSGDVATETKQDVQITNQETALTNQREGLEEQFVLYDILKQLKILNMHLASITDLRIKESEVEV
jgi:hypothetical protein